MAATWRLSGFSKKNPACPRFWVLQLGRVAVGSVLAPAWEGGEFGALGPQGALGQALLILTAPPSRHVPLAPVLTGLEKRLKWSRGRRVWFPRGSGRRA